MTNRADLEVLFQGIRLLIPTARRLGYPIVTRDRKIEAHAEPGNVG
jgi:hypothetical protein